MRIRVRESYASKFDRWLSKAKRLAVAKGASRDDVDRYVSFWLDNDPVAIENEFENETTPEAYADFLVEYLSNPAMAGVDPAFEAEEALDPEWIVWYQPGQNGKVWDGAGTRKHIVRAKDQAGAAERAKKFWDFGKLVRIERV